MSERNSVFVNEILAEIDRLIPASNGKVKQVALFSLIDGYMSGEFSDVEFLHDLKEFLKSKQ